MLTQLKIVNCMQPHLLDIEQNIIQPQVDIVEEFEELNLNKDLLRGIFAYGFEKPSAIQKKAIKPIIQEKDVLAQAQSGTGKTGAFTIGALQRIDPSQRKTQVIILAPVPELAKQIFDFVYLMGHYMNIEALCCIGGTSMAEIKEKCQEGVHIIIAIPGELVDMLKHKYLDPVELKLLVIDEADQMLDKGFFENVAEILKLIPPEIQIALFTTTFPQQVIETSNQFLRKPVKILLENDQLMREEVRHFYIAISIEDEKYKTVVELCKLKVFQSIIFCNSTQSVDELTDKLREDHFEVCKIHELIDQTENSQVMKDFLNIEKRILITTDNMSRGIDIPQISLIVNFDFPKLNEQYIHRIGRAGRYGRKGVGINIVSTAELPYLIEVEKFYNTKIEEMPKNYNEVLKVLN